MAERVQLTIDVGPDAPLGVLRKLLDDLDVVCQFGEELESVAALNYARLRVLHSPERYLNHDELLELKDYPARGFVAAPIMDAAVARYRGMEKDDDHTFATVDRLTYNNPLEIILGVGGTLTVMLLKIVRDWPARRRLNDALALDMESAVNLRVAARRVIQRAVADEDVRIRLTHQQIDALLTPDVARSLAALGDNNIDLRELDSGE